MGTRQARRQRSIDRAHERYAGTLLALGMPEAIEYSPRFAGDTRNDTHYWFDNSYRERVRVFYIAAHLGTPAPTQKTVKKFVRSYMAWLKRECDKRRHAGTETYRVHGVEGRRRVK